MTSMDEIRDAQEQVAALQARLDNARRIQRVAERSEAAKQRAQRVIGVSTALLTVGAVLVAWGGRKRRAA